MTICVFNLALRLDYNKWEDFSIRSDVREGLKLAAMDMKRAYDRSHTWKVFSPGDEILIRLHKGYTLPANKISSTIMGQNRLSSKLREQFTGPFPVKRRVSRLAYKLELPEEWQVHPVFPISLLEECLSNDLLRRIVPQLEEISTDSDGVKWWEIEKIVDKRIR